jgi:hypothetical protein
MDFLGFQNSYLDLEEFKLIIVAHPDSKNLKKAEEYYEVDNNIAVGAFSIPDVFDCDSVNSLDVVTDFVNGNFSKLSKNIKYVIYKSILPRTLTSDFFKVHIWFYNALQNPIMYREQLSEYLDYSIDEKSELISCPNENNFKSLDEVLSLYVTEHESTE